MWRRVGAAITRREQARLVTAVWVTRENALQAHPQLTAALLKQCHDRVVLSASCCVIRVCVERECEVQRVCRCLFDVRYVHGIAECLSIHVGTLVHKLLAASGCEVEQCAIVRLLIQAEELGRRHAVLIAADVHIAALVERPLVKLLAHEHHTAVLVAQHGRQRRECGRNLEEGGDVVVVGAARVLRRQLCGLERLRCRQWDVDVVDASLARAT
eukprot:2912309-Prymnesium_polylepis.2